MIQTSDRIAPVVRFCLCQTRVALQRWMRIRRDGGRTQEFGECVRKGRCTAGGGWSGEGEKNKRASGRIDEHESVRER